jgi:hypothetical protein
MNNMKLERCQVFVNVPAKTISQGVGSFSKQKIADAVSSPQG